MQSQWGRIAEDGTVFVITPDGEREIGSWHAGNPEAGLRHYQVRYDDLVTEVDLLRARLESGVADPEATRSHAVTLKDQLPTAAVIGDLAALATRLDELLSATAAKAGERAAAREQARASAIAAKESLAAEAEKIAQSATNWKASGERLRTIVEEWKQIKGIDRRTDEALWKRFAAARDGFGKRRSEYFGKLDVERDEARKVKQKLIARAEELSSSSDWKQTTADLRDLMTEWKSAPRAGRDVEDRLWAKFRAAQDAFFARRSGVFAERDAEQVTNRQQKETIIAEAGALDLSDPRAAQAALRDLQSRFDAIGHVPRDAVRRVDDRMRAAEQRVRDAVDAQWRQAGASASPILAAMRERLAEAEAKLERARKAGDSDRIAKAEIDVAQRRSLIPE